MLNYSLVHFQGSIYRAFEETESLLAHLRQGTGEEEEGKASTAGAKMPKVGLQLHPSHPVLKVSKYNIFMLQGRILD